ncbi:MAG TPA: FUSC family membrane protein, partial [Puia sp.]|nr:FUSC family membrane protein [Puia sp.]
MDYIKEYKSFINSYYLSEGIRITTGILLPALVLNYFANLPAGIIVSIGAMCVSTTDNAGPIHHRRNGMLACCGIIFIVSLLTGLAADSTFLLGALIFIFCFLFSMINVYGNRAGSIGISALLMMVLSMDHHYGPGQVTLNSLYVLCGGAWYTVLSLLLYGFRPYKLAQQALGDFIQATADYLFSKIDFYDKQVDYEKSYRQLREQQSTVQEKQTLVRELLFKSRDITKESTATGRILLMIFLDIADLFE